MGRYERAAKISLKEATALASGVIDTIRYDLRREEVRLEEEMSDRVEAVQQILNEVASIQDAIIAGSSEVKRELEKAKNNLLMAKTHFLNALEEANRRNASQLESEILVELAMIAEQQNNLSEQRMYNERAVEIWIQNEQPIPQWYIDNGY